MASKNTQEQFARYLLKHPEVIDLTRSEVIHSHMACTLTIVLDYLVTFLTQNEYTEEEVKTICTDLMDYFLMQLAAIGKADWEDFFHDVNKLLKKDIGFIPMDYIQEHLQEEVK